MLFGNCLCYVYHYQFRNRGQLSSKWVGLQYYPLVHLSLCSCEIGPLETAGSPNSHITYMYNVFDCISLFSWAELVIGLWMYVDRHEQHAFVVVLNGEFHSPVYILVTFAIVVYAFMIMLCKVYQFSLQSSCC